MKIILVQYVRLLPFLSLGTILLKTWIFSGWVILLLVKYLTPTTGASRIELYSARYVSHFQILSK